MTLTNPSIQANKAYREITDTLYLVTLRVRDELLDVEDCRFAPCAIPGIFPWTVVKTGYASAFFRSDSHWRIPKIISQH
jgi:hypothetical protein